MLLIRTGRLFAQTCEPIDDFYVAAFMLWGITAIQPFDDGNGPASVDFIQHTLMRRWSPTALLFERRAHLDRRLQPVLAELAIANDGSPEHHVAQVNGLIADIEGATLESLQANPHFAFIAKVFAASLQLPKARS